MAAPSNLVVNLSPLTLAHGASTPVDASVIHVSGDSSTNGNAPDNPANVFIHVTTPPAAGTITVAGVPGSDFTLAQAQAGQVVYHNDIDPSAMSDTFGVWARYNEGTTPLPLAPRFVTTAVANAPGAEQSGLYFGAMLTGAVDANLYRGHFQSIPRDIGSPFIVSTPEPNCVLLVCVVMTASRFGSATPATFTVINLDFAGLSFTRLSQQIRLIHQPTYSSMGGMLNQTMEVWWAMAPAAVSGAFTMTTQPLTGELTVYTVDVTVFGGLANPAAPFDTNASNFPHLISTAPPWTGMTMTPTAPEYRTLPWVYELVAGNADAVSPMAVPGSVPKGYGIVNRVAQDTNNFLVWHSAGRAPAAAAASVVFTGAVPAVTLAMDDVAVTARATRLDVDLISLRWSDDRGHSWGSPVTQDIGAIGEYRTSLQWQRLGMARDRVFELSWSVPMPTALQGAWIDVTSGGS